MRKLKIPNQLRLDFRMASWYLSDKLGLAQNRRIPWLGLFWLPTTVPPFRRRALGILKGEGFEVETVSNGVAAIKRLAVLHPVVILADVSMPGRDGYEVCEFVKKSAELSQVPVLLVASDMEPYDDARGAEVRADGIIKKPFEPHELISIVVKFAEQFEALRPPATPAPSATREAGVHQGIHFFG